ncbi:PREDICTED: vesicle-associated membrane protein 2-like [Leptosomus discolor]|uniref:vesicle-associated membrane protein 2-like n=1 Tax=Leptosomus discolor TaxID=188344 RepID=UPI0005224144|nr:PREDICTED: vesicle-associated membrane protein 2-like [Leptosomus discolor]
MSESAETILLNHLDSPQMFHPMWLHTYTDPAPAFSRIAHGSAPAPTQSPTSAGAAGPPPATNVSSNKRLQQTQARVDEVVDIMRMNVDKVLERDQKLSELDNRADALQAGASQFETSAAKLKRKYWWKNCKMMIILGVVCAVILIIIIIYFST